jgi:hypothetical protein
MNKSTRNLLIVFVILAVIVFIFFKGKDKISTEKVEEKLFTADSSKIEKIEIVKDKESITVEKVNGKWMVTKPVNYPADTLAITPMLSDLKNFQIESIISENPEKFSTYLDSVNNASVSVYQEGKKLGTFILGKSAISYENSYIKLPDQNKILLATHLGQNNFTKPLKDFRYKIIMQVPSFSLTSISFKSNDSNKVDLTAIKDSSGRWFIGTDSIPSVNISGFLNQMENFTTEDFIDSVITEFPAPVYTITLNGQKPTVINLYKMPNTAPVTYMIQVSDIKQIFKVSEAIAGTLTKKKKDFIPEKTPEKKEVTPPTTKTPVKK